jgi:hypothetical protein
MLTTLLILASTVFPQPLKGISVKSLVARVDACCPNCPPNLASLVEGRLRFCFARYGMTYEQVRQVMGEPQMIGGDAVLSVLELGYWKYGLDLTVDSKRGLVSWQNEHWGVVTKESKR